jgi:hypothetical protein
MPGDWLQWAARRLLHEDTFDLLVAPALADLQVDECAGAYAAVFVSLAYASCVDTRHDLLELADDAGTLVAIFTIQAAYYAGMLTLLAAGVRARDAITILLAGGTPQFFAALTVVVLLSVVPTLLCFWPPRRVRES